MGLGAGLRKAREECRMSTRSVAERIGVSHTSIARTELGTRTPEPEEVIALCAVYGITGRRRDQLIEQVDGTDFSSAWLATGPATAQQITSLVALETRASEITDVSLTWCRDCCRHLSTPAPSSEPGNDAEWLLSTRLARQALLTRPDGPSVRFLVDEFALRRVIGGNTATRHQLEHLNRVQENPRVRIQVVPRDAGVHAGLDGAFVVLEFPAREPHVYVESRRVGLFLTRPRTLNPSSAE
ncbi:helix-turn-helix transcriptional regulator [Saccharopolyspora sp. 6T]|nr:helix-turn-helix transcriptional regulator [Saccharopolyspora sp. 6T]MCA1185658.1 helix-turn-helix transcriptional regulator [Saccharopolyspora sp. 6T]